MKSLKYTLAKTGKPVRFFNMREAEYHAMDNDGTGLCLACGAGRGCCEPDARNYECESCGEKRVFGVPELFMMGRVFVDNCDSIGREIKKEYRI